jgi:hypothetical protein
VLVGWSGLLRWSDGIHVLGRRTRVPGYRIDHDAPVLVEAPLTVAGRDVTPWLDPNGRLTTSRAAPNPTRHNGTKECNRNSR